jgi:hypothetical protein
MRTYPENPETGFLREYLVTARRFSKKPGFFGFEARVSETGFLREYLVTARRFSKKPGFFGFEARVLRNRVFGKNT